MPVIIGDVTVKVNRHLEQILPPRQDFFALMFRGRGPVYRGIRLRP